MKYVRVTKSVFKRLIVIIDQKEFSDYDKQFNDSNENAIVIEM